MEYSREELEELVKMGLDISQPVDEQLDKLFNRNIENSKTKISKQKSGDIPLFLNILISLFLIGSIAILISFIAIYFTQYGYSNYYSEIKFKDGTFVKSGYEYMSSNISKPIVFDSIDQEQKYNQWKQTYKILLITSLVMIVIAAIGGGFVFHVEFEDTWYKNLVIPEWLFNAGG